MNLSRMFDEDMSLNNIKWLDEAETYKPKDKDTNKKDDLAIEWNTNLDIPEDMPVTTIKDEMYLNQSLVNQIFNCAKVLMHQGLTKKTIIDQLLTHFKPEEILQAKSYLDELFKNIGFTGIVVIDLKNTDNVMKEKIFKAWKKSKYAHLTKYVLMDKNDIESRNGVTVARSYDNNNEVSNIDSFIASETPVVRERYISNMFGKMVIAGYEDLPEDDYDDTLIDLVTVGQITEEEKNSLKGMELKEASKKLFKIIKAKENKKAETVVDKASEYNLKQADNEIDIAPEAEEMLDIDVEKKADNEIELTTNSEMNVDPYQAVDTEFKGSDAFELEEEKKAEKYLDINHRGGFDF